jgi:hypothetical protein
MLTRDQRIAQGQARIVASVVEKVVAVARNIGGHWGVPPDAAVAALEQAASDLRAKLQAGSLDWPTEEERRVCNGTPDQTVRSMASAIIRAQAAPPTTEAVARTLQARGVRRRRVDLLRLVNEARKPAR